MKLIILIYCIQFLGSIEGQLSRNDVSFPESVKNVSAILRIIGGTEVTPFAYPFQAALLIRVDNEQYLCGGTLITEQIVLTAAHCVDYASATITVLLGCHNLREIFRCQLFTTTEYYRHENWNSTLLQNDIALVRLPRKAILNRNVSTVQTAKGTNSYANKTGITLGWGITEAQTGSDVLKEVSTTVLDNTQCAEIYRDTIKSSHLCSLGQGIKGSCNGDSGGPILVDGVQVGIVSFGEKYCRPGYPTVYTRLTEYTDWFNRYLNNSSIFSNSAIEKTPFLLLHMFSVFLFLLLKV